MFSVDGRDAWGILLYCLNHVHDPELMQPFFNDQVLVPELMARMFSPSEQQDTGTCPTSMLFFLSLVPLLPWPIGI